MANLPHDPDSLQQAGLAESTIESLILKILYFRGDLYGRELSQAIGLKFSVIQGVVESLKIHHHLQVKRSLGVGDVGAVLALTDTGRARAREALEANRYAGRAPVPLDQYVALVREQKPRQGWLTRPALERALRGMVITEHLLSQVGPAISSATSLLLYGKPGDGKTYLIESLNNLDSAPVFVPYAIECQGNIIQVFDPVYHHRIQDEEAEAICQAVGQDAPYDHRWVKCRRPFIVSGGELTLDMLDLRYNDTSKIYEAPFQLKANNGIYLIDDFGRQRAAPAEVLNRWIVPMERRVDFLSFLTGGKMTVPFETFLVFSTNLNPADLGDEAFLRRIQYKMLLRGPGRAEFELIFQNCCASKQIPYGRDAVNRLIERYYVQSGKPFRRCQPRDILTHAVNLIHFEKLPHELTDGVLKRAFESCFLQEEEDASGVDLAIVNSSLRSCAELLEERISAIPTHFGKLAWLAARCNPETGVYADDEAAGAYPGIEVSQSLALLHLGLFRKWLGLGLEQQSKDLAAYLSGPEGRTAALSGNRRELCELVSPAGARSGERDLFRKDLNQLMTLFTQPARRPEPEMDVQFLSQTA